MVIGLITGVVGAASLMVVAAGGVSLYRFWQKKPIDNPLLSKSGVLDPPSVKQAPSEPPVTLEEFFPKEAKKDSAIPLSKPAPSHHSQLHKEKMAKPLGSPRRLKIETARQEAKILPRGMGRREKNKEQKQSWALVQDAFGSVFIHEELYNTLGITAFREASQNPAGLVSFSSFIFSSRELSFCPEPELAGRSVPVIKPKSLIHQFQRFADQRSFNQAYLDRIADSLNPIMNNPGVVSLVQDYAVEDREVKDIEAGNPMVVFNPKRREEIFLPFTVDRESDQNKLGLHVYPWLSRSEGEFKFSGFEHFVTAVCMFGSSLKGVSQHGASFPLIKHDRVTEQKIIGIRCEELGTYEAAQFEDFEKFLSLVRSLSSPGKTPKLYCHLPYYDYMLFGIELLIRGSMTFEALEDLVQNIFKKRNEYVARIKAMSEEQGVDVIIASPFDNIFGVLASEEQIIEIFETLKLTEQPSEAALVQLCLTLLMTNENQPEHREVWQDFIEVIGKENVTTLEELFKIGNAVMVAVASHGKSSYQVCSLLPLSEKQISVSYADHSKKLKGKSYPAVVNFTYLDAFLGYSLTNKGLAFYFEGSQTTASRLIAHGILKRARKNAATHSGSRSHQPLEKFLQEFRLAHPLPVKESCSPSPTKRSLGLSSRSSSESDLSPIEKVKA